MRKKGLWFQIIFSLVVVVVFAYAFNLMPSKTHKVYTCTGFDLFSKREIGKVDVEVNGEYEKRFFSMKDFTGTIKIGEEVYKCEDQKFKNNILVLNNNRSIFLMHITTFEKEITIIPLEKNMGIKDKIYWNKKGSFSRFKEKYDSILKKVNKR